MLTPQGTKPHYRLTSETKPKKERKRPSIMANSITYNLRLLTTVEKQQERDKPRQQKTNNKRELSFPEPGTSHNAAPSIHSVHPLADHALLFNMRWLEGRNL